jgi:NAD(P)-dependent dehydrogenase (short-subunit alcohol dehydrogenase family)
VTGNQQQVDSLRRMPLFAGCRPDDLAVIAAIPASGPACNETYASTKAALIAFTQSLRASYRGSGVSASVVCPGFVESGMYERSRRHGLRAPLMLGSTTPEAVSRAVITAVRKDQPEIILNPGPIRLMMALPTMFPGIAEWGRRRLGADNLYRKAAEIRERRRMETGR